VVIGQLARDIVLLVDEIPPAGAAADVRERRETLGGYLQDLPTPVLLTAADVDASAATIRAADAVLVQKLK